MTLIRAVLPFALALLLLPAAPAAGQSSGSTSAPDPGGLTMDRPELESLLEELESTAASPAFSSRMRDRAAQDAQVIRDRLERGDFRVGDRITLVVEGEPNLPEEYPVEPGPSIRLPVMGSISLEGVLRSELEAHLTEELSRFIRDPVVRAESEVRVAILGNVGNPGFYTVPAEMLVGEALMFAGGPGATADLEAIRIERQGQSLWTGEEVSQAIADGRTLDQLNVRAGDQIMVPQESTGNNWARVARWGAAIATSVLFGVRVFF